MIARTNNLWVCIGFHDSTFWVMSYCLTQRSCEQEGISRFPEIKKIVSVQLNTPAIEQYAKISGWLTGLGISVWSHKEITDNIYRVIKGKINVRIE